MGTQGSLGLIGKFSYLVGTSEPALRLLLSVLLGYPIAIFHRKYVYGKDPNIQHLYHFAAGLALGYFNYGCDVVHSSVAMLITYIILVIFGGSAISVALTFIFNMSYLLIGYYYVGTEDYDINWTMPQCVLVLRLIGLAFDLYDGNQPYNTLSPENKKVALQKMPTFLETCGLSFFPASYLVGPQFPMKRYQNFVDGKFSDNDPREPPNSVIPAMNRFLLGITYLLIFQILGVFASDEYILSSDYQSLGFIKKIILLGVWGRYTLYKYISCWLLTEGACILFGLTYNGTNENGMKLWNGLENVKISVLENATEFNHYILSFNINTNHWVAQYIYKRLKFFGSRLISQGVSLLFLAIWHGFHSGYYICFAFEFIVMYMEKDLKPLIERNTAVFTFLHQYPVNNFVYLLLRLYTFVFMGWCLLPFALLTYDRYWPIYSSVYYVGFIFFGLYPIIYGPILKLLLKSKSPSQLE